jgi:hypothetical protein
MIDPTNVQVHHLSSLKWNTPTLQSNYHTYSLQHQQINFTNGVTFNIPRVLLNAKNVTINNSSIIILTNSHRVNSIFAEPEKQADIKNVIYKTSLFLSFFTPMRKVESFVKKSGETIVREDVIKPEEDIKKFISIKYGTFSLIEDVSLPVPEDIFNLIFKDDYVIIQCAKDLYFTDIGSFLQLAPAQEDDSQKFDYILNKDNIILFKYKSNFSQAVNFITDIGLPSFTFVSKITEIPNTSVIHIEQLKHAPLSFNSIKNSYISKYNTNPLSASNTLEEDFILKNRLYSQNYLVNIPLNSYFDSNQPTAYINSLKNYQTSNYNYLIRREELSNRDYTGIFTGNNQNNGYSNIYLNFKSNTLEKVFAKDTETTFHYPSTCPTDGIPLSASNLIEEGAISGKNPYTSDRVLMSRRDYRELNIPTLSAIIADNTWLYSWLSAGDNGESVWMDRFYTGADFNLTDYEYLSYKVNDPLFIDIPSTLYFLPNRVYKYFHQGPKNIKTYLNQLSTIDRDNTTKILEINDWSKNELKDSSVFKNNGLITLNTTDLATDYFYLDGKSFAIFPATPSLAENKQLYIGFWLKVNDWNEIEGSQIIGNYADGGYGLFNKQIIPTSYITMVDNNNNYLYNFNSNFKVINEQQTISSASTTNNKPIYILRTSDQSYWLINSNNITASKYDLNNNLIFELTQSDLRVISNITQADIDDIERIYIFDNISKKIVIFDSNTGIIISGLNGIDFNYRRFELVIDHQSSMTANLRSISTSKVRVNDRISQVSLLGVDGNFSVTDNNQNIWYSVGVNLYKNKSLYANIGTIDYITCDNQNNIWILHDRYNISKIDTITNLISFTKTYKSTVFAKVSDNEQKRFINFISIKENNKEVDFPIIIDNEEKTCYILKSNGDIYNKINLLIIPTVFLAKNNFERRNINFTCYGDFTGYQYQRKFNSNKELTWKIKVTQSSGYTERGDGSSDKVVYLPFSTASIDQGWHYFSFCFNHQKGYIKAYVDSIEVSGYTFNPFNYVIKPSYKPLAIGAVTNDQGVLNDTIGINDKHKIIAYIAYLHIYKYVFDENDIKLFHKSTFVDMYKDLVWNINIGTRNYIEQIDKFFMQKMPGNKSKFFNLKIKNFPASAKQKDLIEQALRATIDKIVPADTTLKEIKWS